EDARLTAMWLWTIQTAVGDEEDQREQMDDEGEPTAPAGYSMEYDAARKIGQGLGAHLENLDGLIEVRGETAILLSAAARTKYLFVNHGAATPRERAKKKAQMTLELGEQVQGPEGQGVDE